MLWSTSPKNRVNRGQSLKKDIARKPAVRKKSKIFQGYSKTIEPPTSYFSSKAVLEPKKGRYVADLFQLKERTSFNQTSLMQSSLID